MIDTQSIETQPTDEMAATRGGAAAGKATGDSTLRSQTTDTLALKPYALRRKLFVGAVAAQGEASQVGLTGAQFLHEGVAISVRQPDIQDDAVIFIVND